MSWLIDSINILLITFLGYLLYKADDRLKPHVLFGLPLKITAGWLVGILYFYYYGYGDTVTYHRLASRLTELFYLSPRSYFDYLLYSRAGDATLADLAPRVKIFVKLISPLYIASNKGYWIVSAWMSFAGFASIWYLVRGLRAHFNKESIILFAFLYFPDMLFWTSGIIKETIAYTTICIFVLSSLHLSKGKVRWYFIVLFIASFFLLFLLKYYLAAIFGVFALLIILIGIINNRYPLISTFKIAGLIIMIGSLALFLFGLLKPNLRLANIPYVIVENYRVYEAMSSRGNMVVFENLEPTWGSVMLHAPKAFLSGLFRPFIWEAANWLQVFYALENLILLILTGFAIFTLPKKINHMFPVIAILVLGLVVTLITMLTLSSPNYGTLVRYRSVVMPFFVLLITYNNTWLESWLNKFFGRTE